MAESRARGIPRARWRDSRSATGQLLCSASLNNGAFVPLRSGLAAATLARQLECGRYAGASPVSQKGAPMTRGRWLVRTALIATAGWAAVLHAQPAVNPTAAAVHAFQQRVADYMKVHRAGRGQGPRPEGDRRSAEDLDARGGARRDDSQPAARREAGRHVLPRSSGRVLLKLIHEDFASRSAADRRALIEELPAKFQLSVNMTYPTTLPLVTVPGQAAAGAAAAAGGARVPHSRPPPAPPRRQSQHRRRLRARRRTDIPELRARMFPLHSPIRPRPRDSVRRVAS